jgi:hypothetical protein
MTTRELALEGWVAEIRGREAEREVAVPDSAELRAMERAWAKFCAPGELSGEEVDRMFWPAERGERA